MARNRIMFASQSVWVNGVVLYRVQTLGSTTTFTNEDIFEIGHLDIIDVVDDVPSVAITLNTNDWGDLKTLAVLAQVTDDKISMDATATSSNANLAVVSGTQLTKVGTYLHGACLADFSITCGNLTGVSLWAPVQSQCDQGTLANNIDQTMFMDEVYVNSLEFSYTAGANATENYGAETDQKMWLLNAGRFVSWESWLGSELGATVTSGFDMTLASGNVVATFSDGSVGFLRTDANGYRAVSVYDVSENEMTNWRVEAGTSQAATYFVYDSAAGNKLYAPGNLTLAATDKVYALYSADAYATGMYYFYALDSNTEETRPDALGAVRQGQIEVYLVGPTDTSFANAWRLTGVTISADLTREPLTELGHLGPYDRPLTLPIPITVTVDATAGDLEHWSRFADRYPEYVAGTMDEIDLADLMTSEDLKLVVKIYVQTDEEAGGTGSNRKVKSGAGLDGRSYFNDGVKGTYSPTVGNPVTEYAVKTVIVEHLKMTDEGYTLDMGTNASQSLGFRSTNDLYVVKGDVSITNLTNNYKVRRNS
jgi:hypothetical protein